MTICVLKCHRGEHFANLEMLTTLLPRRQKDLRRVGENPGIEVVAETHGACSVDREGGASHEEVEEEFDWRIEQSLPSEKEDKVIHVIRCRPEFYSQILRVYYLPYMEIV